MQRDGEYPTQPSQGQPGDQPPPPAQPWQPVPPELLGQPARPSQSMYPPAGGYYPEQPAYMQTPPAPEMPGAGFGAPYPQQAPTYQDWNAGGYAPPSAPMGAYGPPVYPQPGYQPPAIQPKRANNGGWVAIGALGLIVVLFLLFIAPGLAKSHTGGNTGGNNTQGFNSNPTNTPYGGYNAYPTDTPYTYPTDTPYTYPTDTPVPPPSFPLSNDSANMQMGTGYVNGNPPQITGQTGDFSSGDSYALLLNMGSVQENDTQVNFELWKRYPDGAFSKLASQAQPVKSAPWSWLIWTQSVGQLMGSGAPGQYRIYITNARDTYFGYVDFNYHG